MDGQRRPAGDQVGLPPLLARTAAPNNSQRAKRPFCNAVIPFSLGRLSARVDACRWFERR
jgi:hypothetical protein